MEARDATPEGRTLPQPQRTWTQTQQAVQAQASQALQAAPISLGASATDTTVATAEAVYATAVAVEEGSEARDRWQVELSPDVWSDFPTATMRMFSSAVEAGGTSVSLSARGRDYMVDLNLMVQRNIATGTARKIRRVELPHAVVSLPTDNQSGENKA